MIERVLSLLAEARLAHADAARYYVAYSDIIWRRVLSEIHGDITDPSRMDRAEATLASLPEEQFTHVRRALARLRVGDEELFETELDLFTRGVRDAAKRSSRNK